MESLLKNVFKFKIVIHKKNKLGLIIVINVNQDTVSNMMMSLMILILKYVNQR